MSDYSPSELFSDVARCRVRDAVLRCEQMKAAAHVRVQEWLQKVDGRTGALRPALRVARSRAARVKLGLTTRGTERRLQLHPELRGLPRSDYNREITRQRRARLYEQGLTCRGTPRIMVPVKKYETTDSAD